MLGSLMLVVAFAACGSNATDLGGQPGPTATAPLRTQNCGTLHSNISGLLQADKSSAMQDETCFFNAYKQCHPATLTYQVTSLDTGVFNNLAVKNSNGSCSLTDGVQHFIAPKPPGAATTYTCSSASMEADGLHIISCGDAGDLLIPLK
jgi:hypothetical protein